MEEPILLQNNHEEQLYYPPLNYISDPDNNICKEDKFFLDETTLSGKVTKKKNYSIIRNDINSFIINVEDIRAPIYFLFIFLIILAIAGLISIELNFLNIMKIIGSYILLNFVPIYFGFKNVLSIYLLLESNSIIMTQKTMFSKKITIYNHGELERAEIYYEYLSDLRTKHIFKFYFVKKNGKKEEFHKICLGKLKKLKGVKYFIDLLNQHIQKNMK